MKLGQEFMTKLKVKELSQLGGSTAYQSRMERYRKNTEDGYYRNQKDFIEKELVS